MQSDQSSSYPNQQELDIYNACANGNLETVRQLVEQQGLGSLVQQVITVGQTAWTPLHVAAWNSQLDVLRYLYQLGLLAMVKEPATQRTPLDVARLALQHNVGYMLPLATAAFLEDPAAFIERYQQLCEACQTGKADVVTAMLVEHGCIYLSCVKDSNGNYISHYAAANGHANIVSLLADRQIFCVHKNADGDTPLHLAVCNDHIDVCCAIERHHAMPLDSPNAAGKTAYEVAKDRHIVGPFEFLRNPAQWWQGFNDFCQLCERVVTGPNRDATNDMCDTADDDESTDGSFNEQSYNVSSHSLQEYDALIHVLDTRNYYARGIDVHGNSPFHFACRAGAMAAVRLLLERGYGPIDAQNDEGKYPIDLARECDHNDVADFVQDCFTIIHASYGGDIATVRQLIEKNGLSIGRIRDRNGNMPFHHACARGQIEVVRFLQLQGLGTGEANFAGQTPRTLAEMSHSQEVISFIDSQSCAFKELRLAAKTDNVDQCEEIICRRNGGLRYLLTQKDSNGNTPLHLACNEGSTKVVQFLVQLDHVNTIANNYGNTPFHVACTKGDLAIVQLLREHKMEVSTRNRNKQRPIDLARKRGHYSIVVMLENHDQHEVNIQLRKEIAGVRGDIDAAVQSQSAKITEEYMRQLDEFKRSFAAQLRSVRLELENQVAHQPISLLTRLEKLRMARETGPDLPELDTVVLTCKKSFDSPGWRIGELMSQFRAPPTSQLSDLTPLIQWRDEQAALVAKVQESISKRSTIAAVLTACEQALRYIAMTFSSQESETRPSTIRQSEINPARSLAQEDWEVIDQIPFSVDVAEQQLVQFRHSSFDEFRDITQETENAAREYSEFIQTLAGCFSMQCTQARQFADGARLFGAMQNEERCAGRRVLSFDASAFKSVIERIQLITEKTLQLIDAGSVIGAAIQAQVTELDPLLKAMEPTNFDVAQYEKIQRQLHTLENELQSNSDELMTERAGHDDAHGAMDSDHQPLYEMSSPRDQSMTPGLEGLVARYRAQLDAMEARRPKFLRHQIARLRDFGVVDALDPVFGEQTIPNPQLCISLFDGLEPLAIDSPDVQRGTFNGLPVVVKQFTNIMDAQGHNNGRNGMREMRKVQRLRHPSFIPLYDVFVQRDKTVCMVYPYYTTKLSDYVQKETVRTALRDDPQFVALIVRDLLSVLAAVHSVGVVHCHITPTNIFIDSNGHAILGDFDVSAHGLAGRVAKFLSNSLSELNAAREAQAAQLNAAITQQPGPPAPGTVQIPAAPELALVATQHYQVTDRLDVFSLGECLRLLLVESTSRATHMLAALINQMTAPQPEQRPSAAECLNNPYFQQAFSSDLAIIDAALVSLNADNIERKSAENLVETFTNRLRVVRRSVARSRQRMLQPDCPDNETRQSLVNQMAECSSVESSLADAKKRIRDINGRIRDDEARVTATHGLSFPLTWHIPANANSQLQRVVLVPGDTVCDRLTASFRMCSSVPGTQLEIKQVIKIENTSAMKRYLALRRGAVREPVDVGDSSSTGSSLAPPLTLRTLQLSGEKEKESQSELFLLLPIRSSLVPLVEQLDFQHSIFVNSSHRVPLYEDITLSDKSAEADSTGTLYCVIVRTYVGYLAHKPAEHGVSTVVTSLADGRRFFCLPSQLYPEYIVCYERVAAPPPPAPVPQSQTGTPTTSPVATAPPVPILQLVPVPVTALPPTVSPTMQGGSRPTTPERGNETQRGRPSLVSLPQMNTQPPATVQPLPSVPQMPPVAPIPSMSQPPIPSYATIMSASSAPQSASRPVLQPEPGSTAAQSQTPSSLRLFMSDICASFLSRILNEHIVGLRSNSADWVVPILRSVLSYPHLVSPPDGNCKPALINLYKEFIQCALEFITKPEDSAAAVIGPALVHIIASFPQVAFDDKTTTLLMESLKILPTVTGAMAGLLLHACARLYAVLAENPNTKLQHASRLFSTTFIKMLEQPELREITLQAAIQMAQSHFTAVIIRPQEFHDRLLAIISDNQTPIRTWELSVELFGLLPVCGTGKLNATVAATRTTDIIKELIPKLTDSASFAKSAPIITRLVQSPLPSFLSHTVSPTVFSLPLGTIARSCLEILQQLPRDGEEDTLLNAQAAAYPLLAVLIRRCGIQLCFIASTIIPRCVAALRTPLAEPAAKCLETAIATFGPMAFPPGALDSLANLLVSISSQPAAVLLSFRLLGVIVRHARFLLSERIQNSIHALVASHALTLASLRNCGPKMPYIASEINQIRTSVDSLAAALIETDPTPLSSPISPFMRQFSPLGKFWTTWRCLQLPAPAPRLESVYGPVSSCITESPHVLVGEIAPPQVSVTESLAEPAQRAEAEPSDHSFDDFLSTALASARMSHPPPAPEVAPQPEAGDPRPLNEESDEFAQYLE